MRLWVCAVQNIFIVDTSVSVKALLICLRKLNEFEKFSTILLE